jgi:hypothetical protein
LGNSPKKKLAMSGKSPAYVHRRKNSARAGKPVAGFLNRTAIHIHGRFHPPCQRIAARGVPEGRRPNQLAGMRVTWPWVIRKTTNHHEEPSMAPYLISLALASLVAIAVWEAVS